MSETNRTEPYEVCLKDSDKTIGYACPKCHLFCSPTIYFCKWEDALKAAHDHARTCCADRMCADCGANMGSPKNGCYTVCAACRGKRDDEREKKQFSEATKIPLAEYEHEFLYYEDEFYDCFESLADTLLGTDRPRYAWACYPVDFGMDVERIVSDELENGDHYEEAFENISRRDLKRLQRYADAWCKHVSIRSWMPDFKLAVMLPEEEEETEES